MKRYIIIGILSIIVIELGIVDYALLKIKSDEDIEVRADTSSIDLVSLDLNEATFNYVCSIYEIEHPEIVYAQAILESGGFSSNVYKTKNNFLGLYDSRNKTYFTYKHWSDCLLSYKRGVQSKWDGNQDYYKFLAELPYAGDPNYITKVKALVHDLGRM